MFPLNSKFFLFWANFYLFSWEFILATCGIHAITLFSRLYPAVVLIYPSLTHSTHNALDSSRHQAPDLDTSAHIALSISLNAEETEPPGRLRPRSTPMAPLEHASNRRAPARALARVRGPLLLCREPEPLAGLAQQLAVVHDLVGVEVGVEGDEQEHGGEAGREEARLRRDA